MNEVRDNRINLFTVATFLLGIVCLLPAGGFCKSVSATSGASAKRFYIADFGAKGDGVTDDSLALAAAVDTLCKGKGGILEFERGKTYRLGIGASQGRQIILKNTSNITIRGNGAQLIIHPATGFFGFYECKNIRIEGFTVEYDPLPFTQGSVSQIDTETSSFTVKFDEGYPRYPEPAEKNVTEGYAPWGSIVDRKTHKLKAGFPDFIRFESIDGDHKAGVARVTLTNKSAVSDLAEGDAFLLPLDYFITSVGHEEDGGMIISGCSDITVEDLKFYSNRAGMLFRIIDNEGAIHVRNIEVTWKPGTNRLIASWKDGFHVKDNKVGPVIENCHLEGLLDDSINISVNTIMAKAAKSEIEFEMIGADRIEAGDVLDAFFPDTKEYVANLKVLQNKEGWVTIDRPLKGVVCGNKVQYKDAGATQFYNMTRANHGFEIRNCYFGPQRRMAMLIRCQGGIIENNVINGVGGSGIFLANEIGSFYEGPIPSDIRIENNIFLDTGWDRCIKAYAVGVKEDRISGLQILNNDFYFRKDQEAVDLKNTQGTVFKGNRFFRMEANPMADSVVYRK